MTDEPQRRALRARVSLGLASGAVLASSFPPYNLPVLMPAGIVILIVALRRATVREGLYTGLACGTVYFGGTLFWLTNLFGPASISLIAIAASFPTLFGGLFPWVTNRLSRAPDWLIAAILWTGIEYFRSEIFWLNFGWMGLGYGVARTHLAAFIAPTIGSYGLTFTIVAFTGVFLARGPSGESICRGQTLMFQMMMTTLWLCLFLLPLPPAKSSIENPTSVHMVQSYSEDDETFFRRSKPIPGVHWDVILWPEYSFTSDPQRNPKLWARLQNVPGESHCLFIFGAKDQFDPRDEAAYRNTAFVMDESGTIVGKHVKNHTVHFVRDGIRGTEAKAIPTPLGRLGVAICFDMDYPDVARRLVQDGAEVFLVPNDDPREWGSVQREQHRLMFAMRAIECGRWLARADVAGGTSVTAPNGVEVARVRTSEEASLDAAVGRSKVETIYARGGWRFGQVCLAATLLLLCYAALPARLMARGKLD